MTLVLESQLLERRGFETWSATPAAAAALPRSNAACREAKKTLNMQHCSWLRLDRGVASGRDVSEARRVEAESLHECL
jgi:hypothetical protein